MRIRLEALSEYQVKFMEDYFAEVQKMPRRKEKLNIADKLRLEPIRVNRWFQQKRAIVKRSVSF